MSTEFMIGNRKVGKDCEPFIIAEAGINHNGDIEIAKKMILVAKEAGADAIKFQTFHAEEFVQDSTIKYTYRSQGKEVTESMLKMFKRYEFELEEWRQIKKFCEKIGITFLSTPQNVTDLEILKNVGIEAIKIGSDDFVNLPLIKQYIKEDLPILLSCGMATEEEIKQTLQMVGSYGIRQVCVLQCTSEYPTPPEDVNILKLKSLKQQYPQVLLGFSDHTQGNLAAVMAVTLGARVFEKHFTLDHNFPGPDHWFSEEPDGLCNWINSIREAYRMLGSGKIEITESETKMRLLAHRSITALENIHKGERLNNKNLGLRRPGNGIKPADWEKVIGKKVVREISKGSQLLWEDIENA